MLTITSILPTSTPCLVNISLATMAAVNDNYNIRDRQISQRGAKCGQVRTSHQYEDREEKGEGRGGRGRGL